MASPSWVDTPIRCPGYLRTRLPGLVIFQGPRAGSNAELVRPSSGTPPRFRQLGVPRSWVPSSETSKSLEYSAMHEAHDHGPPDRTIPTTCQIHGCRGFCNLRVSKVNGEIVLNPHVDGSCVLRLDKVAASQLFDILGEWLG